MRHRYIVTFGSGQTPGIGYYTAVFGDDITEARDTMCNNVTDKYSFIYSNEKAAGIEEWNLKYIPLYKVCEIVKCKKLSDMLGKIEEIK